MKIQVETVSPVERKVTIEVDPQRIASELERAYLGLGRRVKLRGFRPGKAPRKVLERQFKDQVESEVVEQIVTATFSEAVREHSIEAVAPPQVSFSEGGTLAEGQPLRYTARVEVKPRVEPKDYRGLAVTRRAPEVTDEMVSEELTKLQDSMAQLVPVEGRFDAQEGDYAVIDHDGSIEGQPFEGSRAEGVTVKVGPGAIQEGFIPQLVGKKVGETAEFDEALPADHRNEGLRGKSAHMKVTLKTLKTRQLPAIDDALAKEVGVEGVDTLEALRARIRADLDKRETRRAESELRDALLKAALEKNEFEVPPALVERAIDAMIEGAAERFSRSGIDIRQLGLDVGRMRADLREQALLQVRGALLLEAIADTEKLDPNEEDYQAELVKIAEEVGAPLAKVQSQMRGKDAREALKNRIREEKAFALLREAATISQ
jgi:trigger factor